MFTTPSISENVLFWLTIVVFVPLYFGSLWVKNLRSVFFILSVCMLGVLWAPTNFGASVFFIFSAALCSRIEQSRLAFGMLAIVLAILGVVVLTFHLPSNFWFPSLIVSISVGATNILQSNLKRSREQLLRTQEEVAHMATIAERERISRDLHDLLGHTLSLITLKAELAGKLLARDVQACQQEIKDIENSARHALSEVRSAVSGYRQVGFSHELNNARNCLSAANIQLSTQIQTLPLTAATENVLALTLREAVTNIVRHANATHCEIKLELEMDFIVLQIQDNGVGVKNVAAIQQGNGLIGMHERVNATGGRLALKVNNGLALQLFIPMGVAL
ncbi:sensor histidine kinase [Solimicrobium silvestre]|uniref:sensor histidine kinase n=1 Tax=Solimicrobium silvestre TaxID=2099400 RepID=UPI001FAFE0A6|nr:sensor histidine kinase [Solimicrobium silvestre]